MVNKGSIVILETKSATFAPCTVVSISRQCEVCESITVSFVAGQKKDRLTKRMVPDRRQETVPGKEITRLTEMI